MFKIQCSSRADLSQEHVLQMRHQRPTADRYSSLWLAPLATVLSLAGWANDAIAVESVESPGRHSAQEQAASEKLSLEKPVPSAVERLSQTFELTISSPSDADATEATAEVPALTEMLAIIADDRLVADNLPVVETSPIDEVAAISESLAVQPLSQAASSVVAPTAVAAELMPLQEENGSPMVIASPEVISQTTDSSAAPEIPWRFVLEPYVYLPFETSGDLTINNIEVPFDYDLGEVLESLTFAAYGRFEAWKGPWAFVFDGYYFNTVESDSVVVNTPPQLQGQLPNQVTIDSTAETAYIKLDFAGAYRFGDGDLAAALPTADTEFDLGPFIFDALAGVRLYFFDNNINLTSDIGQEIDFSKSETFIEPMIGGRARWNLSDHLAVLAAANISGFGIGDLTFSLESYAGIDWMFSGNTSMTAGYRFTYIDYERDDSGLNFFQHGPTLGVKFRF